MKSGAKCLLFLVPCLMASMAFAQSRITETASPTNSEIEAFLSATYAPDEPGAAVIVVDDGVVVHRGAYGLANVELGVALEPEMVFHIGSITKQFTAAAILVLQEQGKLSINDPITKHMPDYPIQGERITIEHLLTHTSGISEYIVGRYYTDAVRADVSPGDLIELFKDQPAYFRPGDEHRYNNSGFVLLGAIIEDISGKSYGDFIRDEIFTPLELDDSHYGGYDLIPNRVSGYQFSDGEFRNATYASITWSFSAGGLLSTVDNLADWHAALADESLPGVSYESMGRRFVLNDGETIDYAYGLTFIDVHSREAIGHGGGYPGFTGISFYLPEDGVYIAVLSNNADKQPNRTEVATQVAAIILGTSHAGEANSVSGSGTP